MAPAPATARSWRRSPRKPSRPRAMSSPRTPWRIAFACGGPSRGCSMASSTPPRPIVRTHDAGAGVHARVRLSNLQRQIVHSVDGLEQAKVEVAARTVRALNPDVTVESIFATVDEGNAMSLLGRYDVIVDGTDSFRARYLLSDAAYLL